MSVDKAITRFTFDIFDASITFIAPIILVLIHSSGLNSDVGTILVAAAGDEILGVFRGCSFTNSDGETVFSSHFPTGTVSSDIVAFVEDDPDAVFEVQCAGSLAQTDVGLNADISYTTGSVKTGMSALEISATTAATSAQLRIMGFSGDPSNNELGSANVNAIVTINEHFYRDKTGV